VSYQRDLEINIYKIDSDIVKQPQKFMKWALKSSRAIDNRKFAEYRLDLLKNRLEKRIRKNPKKYGIKDKQTEGAIKSVINNNRKVKKALIDVINLQSIERIAGKAEEAFKQRQRMLEALVKLKTDLLYSDVKTTPTYREGKRSNVRKEIRRSLGHNLKGRLDL